MSEHASPPPANITMAWTNTVPRSWTVALGNAIDSDSPSPIRSARAANACNPTWATIWSPPPSTTTLSALLPFTSEVPSRNGVLVSRQPQNPLPGGLFRGCAAISSPSRVNDRG